MRLLAIIAIVVIAFGALTWTVLAQTGGDFDLSWFSVDGGGGTSTGGDFILDGTAGQSDAGVRLTGGEFSIDGGFQAGFVSPGAPPPVCGDQNDDGQVNIFDAIIDLQIIAGLIEPDQQQQVLSDVVRDGTINIFDVILTLQHIAGLTVITECGPLAG